MDELSIARGNAWSIENMAAHGAAGRRVTPIGSEIINGAKFEYFKDETGAYWYKSSHGAELDEANKRREAARKAAARQQYAADRFRR